MQKNLLITTGFILISFILGHSDAGATSPWQWEMTLQSVGQQDAMKIPTAIYMDEDSGRYYVVDSGDNRLLAYDRDGKFISSFTASNSLLTPFDVVRMPGMLWIVEKGRNSVTIIDLQDRKVKPVSLSNNGRKLYPDRIEMLDGDLYLLDKGEGNIFVLDAQMEVQNSFQCRNCSSGFVDFKLKNGKLWALEQSRKAVFVFSLDGKLQSTIQLDDSVIDFPRSLAIDNNNYLYILDRHRGTVVVFDSSGQYKYNFLEAGEARGHLYYPVELKFDPWGRLCVVEEGNGRVQIFSKK